MMIVLFRSRLTTAAGADYGAMADAMLARARTMPGFVSFKHYDAEDGERLAIIHWESEPTMRAWAEDVRHREAQRLGRERWYQWFAIEVAEVVRAYDFERPAT
jgi:heme-degrading monooxygenase HmoA